MWVSICILLWMPEHPQCSYGRLQLFSGHPQMFAWHPIDFAQFGTHDTFEHGKMLISRKTEKSRVLLRDTIAKCNKIGCVKKQRWTEYFDVNGIITAFFLDWGQRDN